MAAPCQPRVDRCPHHRAPPQPHARL